jgi:hypothetical protein
MHDSAVPFRRQLFRHGGVAEGTDFDFSAQALAIEPESFFALAVETEVWDDLHGCSKE